MINTRKRSIAFTHSNLHDESLSMCNDANKYMYVIQRDIIFVSLFVPLENLHSFGDVTITGQRQQILTLRLLSSDDFLTCHTEYDTGQPFFIFISKNPCHSSVAERLAVIIHTSINYLFKRPSTVPTGDRTPDLPHARQTLYHFTTAAVTNV